MVINKKAVEMQFHWIFILIAGALILGFFFSFALKQRAVGQERLQYTLISQVDDILAKSQLKGGTAQHIPTPRQGIGFSCTTGCDCAFQIDNAQRQFNLPIFSPSLIKGQDTFIWSMEWEQPYRVTNFLFLTNPDHKYYLVYDPANGLSSKLHSEITKNIPPPITQNKEIVTQFNYQNVTVGELSSLEEEDFEHKFIFIHTNPIVPTDFNKVAAQAIKIDETKITFLSKTKRQNTFQENDIQRHIGLTSIYAAIFAQDGAMYTCGIEHALGKLATTSKVLAQRAAEIQKETLCTETEGGCLLGAPITICQNPNIDVCQNAISDSIIGLLCQQNKEATKTLGNLDVNTLDLLKNRLDTENRKLLQQSCPEVF
jgi:hypothetical protein